MLVSGGFNVYAIEVKNVVNAHPTVQMSAAAGIPDENLGEAVCGVVVLREGQLMTAPELIDFCKTHLARYKAPKRIDFVDELPMNSVGKVLRREVKKGTERTQYEGYTSSSAQMAGQGCPAI